MSCCTAEKLPGVTLETRELMRSTGIVAISHPNVYAPSDCLPSIRPTTAKSAVLYVYQASRPTTMCQPTCSAPPIVSNDEGHASLCGRHQSASSAPHALPTRLPNTSAM